MTFFGHRFRFGKVATFSAFAEEDSGTDNILSSEGSNESMASEFSVSSDGDAADLPTAIQRPAKQPRWMTTPAPAVRAEDVAGYEFHPPPRASSITLLPLDVLNLVMTSGISTVDEL